ncbi:unnamed protein product [Eruca vesicaria subsp. sativa]|uniref:F-box associated beta-propeller type 3 domain-containing protein n=1 Tax=Eruca vesicaria subsp. sativa TaxID=29727 RepID=A0ABC8JJB5_ERUVS|nr:unnamed protein product [Eruca vesicaria subsp. sativa]
MEVPGKHCYFSCMEYVHGLICIEDIDSRKPLVWNPTLGQLLVLPKPKMSSRHMNVFLGYDPVEGKHKVVCLPHRKTCYVCRVFTLGTGQESWRTVKTKFKHSVESFASGRCIKGVIYYLACNRQGYDTVVMSFDVRSEILHMIELPSSIQWDVLITYKGRLACIDEIDDNRLWSLEDETDKHYKWSFQDFLSPLYKFFFQLQGSTHAGEFIYVPFNKSSYIEFYDPVGNSWRRLELEGNSDKEFGHRTMKVFPNHIESLMPL